MGASKSKLTILTYEEAEKRITEKEINRLKLAFNQHSSKKTLSVDKFCSEIFGSFLPNLVSDNLFRALNVNNSQSGINFKELLIGLVILTKGNYEEKCKFFFNLYCNESATGIDLSYLIYACDQITPKDAIPSLKKYLNESDVMPFDNFMKWIQENPRFNEISSWLLTTDFQPPVLTSDSVPQDIYQLIAGITHLDEIEIIELEKTYHRLIFKFSNNLNLMRFTNLVCPPLAEDIVERVFQTFDEKGDGIIDFIELVCGISACCRGPKIERKKFCCKIFNKSMDGKFSREDIDYLFQSCENEKYIEMTEKNKEKSTIYCDLIKSILSSKEMMSKNYISLDDLLIWINNYDFLDPFLDLLTQICIIIFGLKPKNSFEEERVITQWLLREERTDPLPYDHLYLINKAWTTLWLNSLAINNIEKDNSNRENVVRPQHSNPKIAHSISMNNVFGISRKHQYDLTKPNKSLIRENSKNKLNDRFIFHFSLKDTEEIVQNIYADLSSVNDRMNYTGSSSSISSYSSRTSLQEFPKESKPGIIVNQCLLQPHNSKLNYNVVLLTDDGGTLSSTIKFNEDFELLPPPIWNCLQKWYGADIILKRPVWIEKRDINADDAGLDDRYLICKRSRSLVKVEIQLITLLIMKHILSTNTVISSGSTSSNQFNLSSMTLAGGSAYKDLTTAKRQIAYRASFSHKTKLSNLIEFLSTKLSIKKEEMRIWKVIDENNLTLLEDEEKILQDLSLQNFDKILVEKQNSDLTWPEEIIQMVTLKALQTRKASINKGVTGLSNIGNTCFFNSAIQCISNTKILTEYFIRDLHVCEINKNNPHGFQGVIALRYGELIKDIWAGSSNLIVPLKLKMTLDKYSKQFCENQQHDAQELLSVLLDALHEDLNRIDKKPSYKELKDSDGREDEEVAQEAWQAHIETNLSVIVDLFHGLLKSNVCCDICKTNSVRFDAYSMLSLPIPMQLNQDFEVLVFQRNSTIPRKHCLQFNTVESTPAFIYEQLSKQLSIDTSSLLLAIIENNRIKTFLKGDDKIYFSQTLYAYVIQDQDSLPNRNVNETKPLSHEHLIKFVIYHRKLVQRVNYFIANSRIVSETFGYPIVFAINKNKMSNITNQEIYDRITYTLDCQFSPYKDFNSIKLQSSRSVSKPNHAFDCDAGVQKCPFVLSQVSPNIKHCGICHWTSFCHGCPLPINSNNYNLIARIKDEQFLAIDWSLTALHLSFNADNDKKCFLEDKNKATKLSTSQPMDLLKCIESFTKQETLGVDTLYQCYKCKQLQPAHKKLDLWTLPPILIIHLKRFQFLDKRWQKSHKIVHYPIWNLDLGKFIERDSNNNITGSKDPTNNTHINNGGRPIYNLYAVNCHLGNLQMGHYVTYARNKESNKWYLFNDSICKEVYENEITTNSAYLLFYERADLNASEFLDHIQSKAPSIVPHAMEVISDEVESDIKKYCIIQ